jgi:hypothetical protein
MNAKDKVLNAKDLFYEILDFLPGASPLILRSVSKTWCETAAKCRFSNLRVLIGIDYNTYTKEIDWIIVDEQKIPFHLINNILAVNINYSNDNIAKLGKILDRFSRIQEMDIYRYSTTFPINYLHSIRRLTIRLTCVGFERGTESAYFDGNRLELLETLNIHVPITRCIHQNDLKLPPNLTSLKINGTIILTGEKGYFPETLTRLDLHIFEDLPANILPKNLKWFKSGSYKRISSIPPSVTSLHIRGDIKNIKHDHLHELTLYGGMQEHTMFNFKQITTLKVDNKYTFNVIDLPSTLTELDMNVSNYAPLHTEDLPYSLLLLCLRIKDAEYQSNFFKLPPNLRVLNMICERSSEVHLSVNDFPDSLTELYIICGNITLCRGMIPPNLRNLSITADKLYIFPYSISDSVTSLHIPGYTGVFERNVLPSNLTYLRVGAVYETNDALKSYFPSTLFYIHCLERKIGINELFEMIDFNDTRKSGDIRLIWKSLSSNMSREIHKIL